MQNQQRINQHADTITDGDAAPTLQDITAIHDGKFDLCIPRTFAQLQYCVERSQALWQVLLGAHHSVTQQFKHYHEILIAQEKRLERVVPQDPGHTFIVPALHARVMQLDLNHWL